MYKNPPPVTTHQKPVVNGPPPTVQAGVTSINILANAAVKGNPNFDPNDAKVPLGNKIVWINQDNAPHTATSGTGSSDSASAKIFDTKVINPNEKSAPVDTTGMKVGDTIPYYCQIHPYMTGKITITATVPGTSGGAASGPTLNILANAAVKGNPNYQPDALAVKKGDTIQVINQDSSPHTVTSGDGTSDSSAGKDFDTKIIDPNGSATISTVNINQGDYNFFCQIHPYMTGKLKVT